MPKPKRYAVIGTACRDGTMWQVAQIGVMIFVFPEGAEAINCAHRYKDWEAMKREWPEAVRLRG